MSIDQDIKRHGIEESKYNQWYESNYPDFFQRVKESYPAFEGFLNEYYPAWMEVEDLKVEHEKFLSGYYSGLPIARHWLEECHELTDKWLKEY